MNFLNQFLFATVLFFILGATTALSSIDEESKGERKIRNPKIIRIAELNEGGLFLDPNLESVILTQKDRDDFGMTCSLSGNMEDLVNKIGIKARNKYFLFSSRLVPNQEFERPSSNDYDIKTEVTEYSADSDDPAVPSEGAIYSSISFPLELDFQYTKFVKQTSSKTKKSPNTKTKTDENEPQDSYSVQKHTVKIKFELKCSEYIRYNENRNYLYMHEIENIWKDRIEFE